MFSLYWTEY